MTVKCQECGSADVLVVNVPESDIEAKLICNDCGYEKTVIRIPMTTKKYPEEPYCSGVDEHRFVDEETEINEPYVYVYDYCDCGAQRVRSYKRESTEIHDQ